MRSSGILMHISSLPSPYGIGTMGKEAREYVDFLAKSAQTYWQVLPVCPTGFGDSPYQSFSAFAGNPYFIDLDTLVEEKLLTKKECDSYDWGSNEEEVDYGLLYQNRYALLRKAFERFEQDVPEDYAEFCNKYADWLEDYSLFMAIKNKNQGMNWLGWDRKLKLREYEAMKNARGELDSEIQFYKMLQYLFYKQWFELKAYANEKGIKIIGDTPIYVACDSADVWANPNEFYLDENLDPIDVAGCPPDAFCEDGQLWGNPLYRWDRMRDNGYEWWVKRMHHMSQLFDVIRIDHFRGFDSYYAIPYGDENARRGKWCEGPRMDLFRTIESRLGKLDIIVEDLGFLTDSVRHLLWESGFPGMKVLQFAFDAEDSDYLPHRYQNNCVVYTGSHDNDTIMGWMEAASKDAVNKAKAYFGLNEEEGYHWGMMRGAWSSVGDMVIIPMQDILGLDGNARMNKPSTLGANWAWRMKKDAIDSKMADKIHNNMKLYGRMPR